MTTKQVEKVHFTYHSCPSMETQRFWKLFPRYKRDEDGLPENTCVTGTPVVSRPSSPLLAVMSSGT